MVIKNKIGLIKILCFILSLIIISIALLSLVIKFKGFPTGIDAAPHVMWAQSLVDNNYPPEFMWKGKNPSPYPIPEIFFALLSVSTGASLECLFPVAITICILAVTLVISLITKTFLGFKGWIFSMFGVLGMKFLLEHLPIGTFAEIYGIFILFSIIYFFIKKRYFLTLFFLFVGLFSHPFVILYSGIIFIAFLPFFIINSKFINLVKRHKTAIIVSVVALTIFVIIAIQFSAIKNLSLLKYIFSDSSIIQGGHAYVFEEIFNTNNFYLLFPLGIIGLISFLQKNYNFNKIFIAFSVPLFGILIFNHLYHINIEPYRFIAYFQILFVVFIAFGISFLYQLSNRYASGIIFSLFLLFLIFFSLNNFNLTARAINFYSADKKGKLPKEDLSVMSWMKDNIKTNNYVCALDKWGRWIPALAQKKVIFGGYEKPSQGNDGCALVLKGHNRSKILEEAKKENLEYVYFSSYYPINNLFLKGKNDFQLLYKEKNAAVYKINLEKP